MDVNICKHTYHETANVFYHLYDFSYCHFWMLKKKLVFERFRNWVSLELIGTRERKRKREIEREKIEKETRKEREMRIEREMRERNERERES